MHLPLYPLQRNPLYVPNRSLTVRLAEEQWRPCQKSRPHFLACGGKWKWPTVATLGCGDTGLRGERILPGTAVRKSMNPEPAQC